MLSFESKIVASPPLSAFKGMFILTKGFKYAFQKKGLLLMSFTPLVIVFISLYFGYSGIYNFVFKFMSAKALSPSLFDFWGGIFLLKIATFFIGAVSFLGSMVVFYILLQIVYIPFCSILAERVLKDKKIKTFDGVLDLLLFNFKMFRVSLLKSLSLVALGLLFFVSSFVPLLSFLPLYFALIVLSYDCFDYGLELYGYSLRERSLFFKKDFGMINGHAGVLFLMSFIPGLILLTLPFSVIGASLVLGEFYDFKREST